MTLCDGKTRRRLPRELPRFDNHRLQAKVHRPKKSLKDQSKFASFPDFLFVVQGPGAVVEGAKKGKAGAKKGGKVS